MIRWTDQARRHLSDLYVYIAEEREDAAERQLQAISGAVETLADFPLIGRVGRCAGTRELVVQGTPYVVAYRLRGGEIQILAVLHGAQRWPLAFS